jgi:2-phosphoglycerate kinase
VLAIGGSSGSGKGTLAIKLAHKLGVRHVLSTDTVRDFVRTKHPRSHPIWLSSYDNMPPEFSTDTQSTYEYQASLLLPALIHTLELSLEDTRCIIVEGVHLSVPTQLKLMAHNLEWCIVPVIVHIPSRDSHMVRFAGRSSTSEAFCLDPKYNKYISNFERIRQIQALNLAHYESLDNREEFLVVENNILDQAVEDVRRGLVQLLRLRYL